MTRGLFTLGLAFAELVLLRGRIAPRLVALGRIVAVRFAPHPSWPILDLLRSGPYLFFQPSFFQCHRTFLRCRDAHLNI